MRLAILICCLMLPFQLLAKAVELKKMDVHNETHRWQFVFHLSGAVNYRIFRLENPDRLVLDLKNVTTKQRLRYKALLGTPIQSLRSSSHKNHIFRIVFDLAMPVKAKIREVAGDKNDRKLELMFTKATHTVSGFDWHANAAAGVRSTSLFREGSDVHVAAPLVKKKS